MKHVYWFLALFWGGLLLLAFAGGCTNALRSTTLAPQAPLTQTAILPRPADQTYQHATATMAQMGGVIMQANPQVRILSATLKGVVVLNVSVQPTEAGSLVEVTETLLPGKVVFGPLDEIQTFLTLLAEQG